MVTNSKEGGFRLNVRQYNMEYFYTLIQEDKFDIKRVVLNGYLEKYLKVLNYHRNINDIYMKLTRKIRGISEEEIIELITDIVMKYNITYKELDVICERFKLVKMYSELGYYTQIKLLETQFEEGVFEKARLAFLHTCEVYEIEDFERFNTYDINGCSYYIVKDNNGEVCVRKGNEEVAKGLVYILLNERYFRFETSERENDRYKFRLYYNIERKQEEIRKIESSLLY